MTERAELLEAALDSRSEGIALLGAQSELIFWNRAAEAITGYKGVEMLFRPVPAALEPLLLDGAARGEEELTKRAPARGALVEAQHKLGHAVQAITQRVTLRDALGGRIGTAVFFHPAQSVDALPHGVTGEAEAEQLHASQAELEARLQAEYDDLAGGGPVFGVLWISVDQAQELRKTHGAAACHAMLDKVRRALGQGLRPAEQMGRWGDDEFLVVAHERSEEMLAAHAQALAGMARTADFRWWGDRVAVTVSIGAAQAANPADETLAQLLKRARQAMEASNHAGGNRATLEAWRPVCSPS
jgi:diguanylate cyclase (GGDEF)-like protein/PAS domain S-box-containing protein